MAEPNNDCIKDIMIIDRHSRRTKSWPLVNREDWHQYQIESILGSSPHMSCLCNKYSSLSPVKRNRKLDKALNNFPYAEDLLNKHYGKLAICGGCFTNRFSRFGVMDVDFFFHSCTETEANQILEDCIVFLCSKLKSNLNEFGGLHPNTDYTIKISLERKLYVTNVLALFIGKDNNRTDLIRKYQFIHRVYPNLGCVLGGFDIGPSMIAFDGKDYWATELGAFSYINQVLIVDPQRRSTTFSNRLRKYYERGFSLVFPGLPASRNFFQARENYNILIDQLFDHMKDIGIEFKSGSAMDYDGNPMDKYDFFVPSERSVEFPDFYILDGKSGKGFGHIESNSWQNKPLASICKQEGVPRTDYGDWSFNDPLDIENMNTTFLSMGLKESVTTYVLHEELINASEEELRLIYANMVNNPIILYSTWNNPYLVTKQICDFFKRPTKDKELVSIINSNVQENHQNVKKMLTGNTWMTQDPGRQWTSSVNPQFSSFEAYYGKWYSGFTLNNILDVIFCLFAMNKCRQDSLWARLPKDIIKHIINILIDSHRFCIFKSSEISYTGST